MNKPLLLLAGIILLGSCKPVDERIAEGRENWVNGTILSEEGTDSIFFHYCYCNIVNSQIILNHVYLGGIHGGNLTTNITQDSVHFDLSYWPYDFKTFSFDRKEVNIENGEPELGNTISGTLNLSGESKSRNQDSYLFELRGRFSCVLRDSTYDHMAWYKELIQRHDSTELLKVLSIAKRKPDSIVELTLNYRNFDLIKDEISLFKNIERLDLSNFPFIEDSIIAKFKVLKELRIDSEVLTELPQNLGDLHELEVLRIAGPVTAVPDGVYKLKNLRELDLGATNIIALCGDIKNLKNLRALDLSYTEITNIPMQVFDLPMLAELSLPDGLVPFKIKSVKLDSIKTLSVSYNFLTYNKEHLGKLKHLEWLYPTFVYKSDEEFMTMHRGQVGWLEKQLPKVRISEITYVNN